MKEYQTGQIRNVALISHNGAGKTTFVERALFNTGVTTRMGDVQVGSAAMDFEEEEVERKSSIATAIAPIEWRDHKINILDTPGFADFIGEVNAALHVVEGAMLFVEAVAGVEVGTEIYWQAADARNLPRVVVINKMDRDNVRAQRALNSIKDNLHGNFVPLQLPIGEGPSFKGVIDLLSMECRLGSNDERAPIPADLLEAAQEARMAVIEAAAEGDDELMEKFFEDDTLGDEDIIKGLHLSVKNGLCIPVLYSAPQVGIAVIPVLNAMIRLLPSPAEITPIAAKTPDGKDIEVRSDEGGHLAAFIFKTREDPYGKMSYIRVFSGHLEADSRVWDANLDTEVRIGHLSYLRGKEQISAPRLHTGDIGTVVKLGDASTNNTLCDKAHKVLLPPIQQPHPIAQVAVHPESQSDVAKLSQALNRLITEDPTLKWHTETATRETILSGMGMTHLEIAIKKAQSKFGVHMTTSRPLVPYRETITKSAQADYTHKKQTGGAGQYARVFIRVESVDDDAEFEFGSEIFGGSVSAPFVAATEKGCRQALESGPVAGFPVVGVKAVIFDGKEHPVDSKEIAFQTAGRECFKKAMLEAGPVLLEPIYVVQITIPIDNMGDIMGDLNTRRARVLGMDQEGTKSIVKAEVPLAEMQTYTADLRSMTQGRGVFSMEFLHYGRVPVHMQEPVIAEAKRRMEHAE
jgi:elongation factor G